MILLIVAHFAMAVSANDNRRVIATVIGDVMQLQAAIVALAARPATGGIRIQLFEASLLSRFPRKFNIFHDSSFQRTSR
jgi:hypothetical protein